MSDLNNKHFFEKLLKISPFIALAVGIIFSSFVAWQAREYENEKERLKFELACKQITILIQDRMATYEQVLLGAAGLFYASENVSRKEWAIFVREQNLSDKFKGIQNFGYGEAVFLQYKKLHEERIQKEGFAYYSIKPSGERPLYVAAIYIEPFDKQNKKAFGFDMYSEKTRQGAIKQAIDYGVASVSGMVKFAQNGDKEPQPGFLMFLPIYKANVSIKNVQDRSKWAQGFVFATFMANELMDGILGSRFIDVDFELYDGNVKTASALLYDSNAKQSQSEPKLYGETKMTLYGQTWTLIFKADDEFSANIGAKMPWYLFGLSAALSLALFALLLSLSYTKDKANKIAQKKSSALAKSEAEIRSIFQAVTEGIIVQNIKREATECNISAQLILQLPKEEIIGSIAEEHGWLAIKDDGSVFPSDELPSTVAFATKESQRNIVLGVTKPNAPTMWLRMNSEPIFSEDSKTVTAVVTTLSDITQYRKSQKELEQYIEMVNTNVITSTTDTNGKIVSVSKAFCAVSGYSSEELVGRNHNIVRHKDMPKNLYKNLWKTIQEGSVWRGEIKNIAKDGGEYWVDSTISPQRGDTGEIIGYISVHDNITDKKRIEELSVTDRLTQLYNRLKLDEIFAMHLSSAQRYDFLFSIIMLDLDRFKLVNDTYGHQAGDEVLKELACILKSNIRETDTVGRWGGEEFLILAPNTNLENAVALAEKLRKLIGEFKFSFTGYKTGSFGVSAYTLGDDETSMVKRADEALYKAKENGRNQTVVG